jgi:uncharacterized protein
MRAFRELRPPGVYPSVEEPRSRALDVANTRIAGFVGLAQKGPLDEPVAIHSMTEFRHVYGALPAGFLEHAVAGFFTNGGDTCYVVRVAHRPRRGERPGPLHAASAGWTAPDGWGKPTLRVDALNEGRWGNSIWARVERHVAVSTLLTLDLDVGAGEARLNSTRGFERGALVRIRTQTGPSQAGQPPQLVEDFVVLHEVEDRVVRWGPETPINHAYKAAGPTFVDVIEFDVFCSLRDRRESFRSLQLSPLSRRYAPRVINGDSQLIRVTDLASRSPLPHCLPEQGPAVRLEGGRDGVDGLTVEDFVGMDEGPEARTGLQALGAVDEVALVAIPDAMLPFRVPGPQAALEVQRIQDAMVDMCERLKDRFALLDGPPTRDIGEVRKWRARMTSSYAALFYPWVYAENQGSVTLTPPSGHLAGVFARCERDNGVHKAPGNEVLRGVTGVSLELREDDLGQLNAEAVNAIRVLPGRGVRVWSARTLSDDVDWRFVNVRRLFIMLRRAIERGTQWAVFESNEPRTWETLSREVAIFLEGQWQKGALAGDSPGQAFYVVCDESTNTPERVDTGHLLMEIGVAPTLPAEYLILHVVQKTGGEERASA